MRPGILSIVFVGVLASSTSAQQPAPPVPGSPTIIIMTPPPPQDRCAPLNQRLNPDECDGLLSPVREIRMLPGEKRTLRFDRPFKTIETDPKPDNAIDVRPGPGSDVTAIVEARELGEAEVFFIGETVDRRGKKSPRCRACRPHHRFRLPEPSQILVHRPSNSRPDRLDSLHEAMEYGCGPNGCGFPGKMLRPQYFALNDASQATSSFIPNVPTGRV